MTNYGAAVLEVTSKLDSGEITLDQAIVLLGDIEAEFGSPCDLEAAVEFEPVASVLRRRHIALEAAYRTGILSGPEFIGTRNRIRSQMSIPVA